VSVGSVARVPEREDTRSAGELEIHLGNGLVLAGGHVLCLSASPKPPALLRNVHIAAAGD
jgi:hypothetical protein